MNFELKEESSNFIVPSPLLENENLESSNWGFPEVKDNIYQREEIELPINKKLCNLAIEKEKEFLEMEKMGMIDNLIEEKIMNNNEFRLIDLKNIFPPKPDKLYLFANNSTNDKSNNRTNKINKCIFGIKYQKKIEPRIDYAIKNFKVGAIRYLKEIGNQLIKNCKFPNKLKKLKLFSPSYKYFTGNSNISENILFLDFSVEQIFSYPEGNIQKNDNKLQRKNKEIIKNFKEYIEEKHPDEVSETFQKLINFFNMTFQDGIKLFYESNEFENYSSSQKTKFLDEQFVKAKEVSLLEKNGFLKFLNNYNKGNNL